MPHNIAIEIRQVFDATKNIAQTNVINAVTSGQIKLDAKQLDQLVSLIGASIDQGFFQGHGHLVNRFEKKSSEETATPRPTKKK